MKITISPEFEDEKRHFHSNRLLFLLLQLTALSDIFFNFGGYIVHFNDMIFEASHGKINKVVHECHRSSQANFLGVKL